MQWQLTDGVLEARELGLDGMMWLRYWASSGISAAVEWNSYYNECKLTVAFGEYVSHAEWQPLDCILPRVAMDAHIQMVLKQWQPPLMQWGLRPSALTKRDYAVKMTMDLWDAIAMPSEA